ncbi:MAG: GDP-L-fucose synthase [Bacteroidetes bacterium]|nr:GDP-L-fucose synthase [Bacteroidota bacterium]
MIDKNKKLYIAGHKGMVGSALMRKFKAEGFTSIVTRMFEELDLRRQKEVEEFFEREKPNYVIIAAAKVGGILANNTYRAEFIYDNLMIESNLIHTAYKSGVEKLIFLGSSCIYPKNAPQPLKEEYLLSGYLESTNEPYAVAKIAGIKLCENYYKQYGCNFYSVMPTNLYGPNDNYDLNTSHVLPALIRKFHEGKERQKSEIRNQKSVREKSTFISSTDKKPITENSTLNIQNYITVWGTGKPRREFMYVDDLADALFFLMNKINAKDFYELGLTHLNIGTGEDLTIAELAELIKKVVGYEGEIFYDTSKPDGTPRKLLDVTRSHDLGWVHSTGLEEGIRKTYKWFIDNKSN